ncbi:phage protein [Spirochaetia bacterium]|nr:phage protein [Spirochaetia bacterium]
MGNDTNYEELRERKKIQEQDNGLFHVHELKSGLFQFTDSTNAERMMKKYGVDIRYVHAWKSWLVWNGEYWKVDAGGAFVHEKGLAMIRSIYGEILETADYREKEAIEKAAIQSESMRRRDAFIRAASLIPELNIDINVLDTNPFLLNVKNGTLDVTTGEFREHRRDDFITKMANVEYDPAAECPRWEKFVREIMDFKPELITFLQTALGWGITGDTSEQVMFILIGNGANGKSTCINVIQNILGEYATTTPTETFMRQSDKISNDIARLRGMHFVSTAEAEQGKKLSESLIKQITGNDRMTARFMYCEFFTFLPTFKIFMATNHKPTITGTDNGIWRRIRIIPFNTTIAEENRDNHLTAKLTAESSGILNWLIKGTKRWKLERLALPPEVKHATDEYRDEMDIIGSFIKDRCEQRPGATIRARELFRCYQEWCEESNEYTCSEHVLGVRLKELDIKQKRLSDGRYWQDIVIKAQ